MVAPAKPTLPKLVVLDLDNTIWTPELYQLRHRNTSPIQSPIANQHVHLMEGAKAVFERIRGDEYKGTKWAIASRTKSVQWAQDLLDQFGIRNLFEYIQIFPGNKKEHFSKLSADSGFKYKEMLFFDDSRDGKYGNCVPVANMGVLAVHCPRGLHSVDVFDEGLECYQQWNGVPGTIVEQDGTMTPRTAGVVKFANAEKRYGFVKYKNAYKRVQDVFFHYTSLPKGLTIQAEDRVTFALIHDSRDGKSSARDIQMTEDNETVSFLAFSMNMPFAALMANGVKTLETRNGTMFTHYPSGTKMLLHVGRRIYPDEDRHIEILRRSGLLDDEIASVKALPSTGNFDRGSIVAICEIGSTYELSLEERSIPSVEQKVVAYGADSGKMVTEIRRVQYLKRAVRCSGQPGVFTVSIDPKVLPEGDWDPTVSNRDQGKPLYSISG